MKITQTNGNRNNGLKGSRISVWGRNNELVDRFVVPSQDAQGYCKRHPNGSYARRLAAAIQKAQS